MALYVPTTTRRRRIWIIAAVALVLGLVMGALAGRLTAPTLGGQVAVIREQATTTSSALRVLALHDQAGVANASGDGGASLVLDQTQSQLASLYAAAPWVSASEQESLTAELAALGAMKDRSSKEFGDAAEALAAHIDTVFGSA